MIQKTERISKIFPKGKVSLILGLPGSGKSTSTIKALTEDDIEPVYFNLDETEVGDNIQLKNMFGEEQLVDFMFGNYEDIRNQVVVIDTYIRVEHHMLGRKLKDGTEITKDILVEMFETLSKKYNLTLIILAHPQDYASREGIFIDNPLLARNCYEMMYLEHSYTKGTGKDRGKIFENFILYIKKGRGYTGEMVIHNWMRDIPLED